MGGVGPASAPLFAPQELRRFLVGFIGLTIPHVARMITGPDYRWALPYSMLLAPVLLLSADIIGRVIARPGEVQVAIVTAVIGAPVFIALVRRRKLAEL